VVKPFPWTEKTISLVGNASSVWQGQFGEQIDRAECVIRINQGAFIELRPQSTGVRTDVLLMSLSGYAWDKAWMYSRGRMRAGTVVAMTPKARTFFGIDLKHLIPVYPVEWHRELHELLGARPSTGAMAVDLLRRTVADVSQISVYGFDFWGSPTTYTGIIKAAPHDPVAEEEFVRSAVAPGRVFQVATGGDDG
jgi:hypothetical protein